MGIEKYRNLSAEELKLEESKVGEQIFRIRFAKSLGKQESVGKLKSLKLDIARIKTVTRERREVVRPALAAAAVGRE